MYIAERFDRRSLFDFFLSKITKEIFFIIIYWTNFEKLNILVDSSLWRLSSSTIFTTSAAAGQDLAIFCNNAIVVLVLNKPTARRLRPCNRQASTAPNQWTKKKKILMNRVKFTNCIYRTVLLHYNFLHEYIFSLLILPSFVWPA